MSNRGSVLPGTDSRVGQRGRQGGIGTGDGIVRSLRRNEGSSTHDIDGVTVVLFDRNGLAGVGWVDRNVFLLARANLDDLPALHEEAMLDFARALLRAQR
jgi:hypothetical protein